MNHEYTVLDLSPEEVKEFKRFNKKMKIQWVIMILIILFLFTSII